MLNLLILFALSAPLARAAREPADYAAELFDAASRRVEALNEAFNHFFFNYSAGPLLVVNTDALDYVNDERHFVDLLAHLTEPIVNTEFYIPSWERK